MNKLKELVDSYIQDTAPFFLHRRMQKLAFGISYRRYTIKP